MKQLSQAVTNALSRREFLVAGSSAMLGMLAAPRVFGRAAAAAAPPSMPVSMSQEPLPYAFDALEPIIDAKTMEIHFTRHHAGYVNNLHRALREEASLQGRLLEDLLGNLASVPEAFRTVMRNHGGGHYNHALFWEWMSPNGGGAPEGALGEAIEREWGSFTSFQEAFSNAAASRFGSGWAWLVLNPEGRLEIGSTANQDNPLMRGVADLVGTPLLGLDVWEHAYYLKYQNRRGDYVQAWWDVVNWDKAEALYADATRAAQG